MRLLPLSLWAVIGILAVAGCATPMGMCLKALQNGDKFTMFEDGKQFSCHRNSVKPAGVTAFPEFQTSECTPTKCPKAFEDLITHTPVIIDGKEMQSGKALNWDGNDYRLVDPRGLRPEPRPDSQEHL